MIQISDAKSKRKDNGAIQQQTYRVMTAKLKKELVQQKQGGGGPTAEIANNFTDITSTANTTPPAPPTPTATPGP